ncbi:MAG: hypothetical protein ACTSU7_09275 [Candidatus Heimdallarchaeaceae archaeon]
MELPIYRAKKINNNSYAEGYLIDKYILLNHSNIIGLDRSDLINYEIDPSTLEISDGIKWRKLDICNFRTDREMDMHLRNGYCEGWNNSLNENQIPPDEKYKINKTKG